MKTCDLHTHSVFSDGTCTPAEILDEAVRIGLSAVALCDHNTVDGLPAFLAAAKGRPIEAIPGAEFSVDYNGTELHLLGLFLSETHFPEISRLMEAVMARKQQSNVDLIRALNRAGYRVDYETIRGSTPNGKFNRAHIARELTRTGYVSSMAQAFDTVLSPAWGYYKEPERLSFWQMLDFLVSIGAVPVLAHPFLNLQEPELAVLLPSAKQKGLVGMECLYPLFDEETTQTAFRLADRYGLSYSGGSDYHGGNKPDIALGTGKNNLNIPYEWVDILKKAAQ